MKLTMNIATRGRPELLRETLARTVPNAVLPDTTIMVSIDEDDEQTIDGAKWPEFPGAKCNVLWSVKKREDSRGEKYDRALKEAPADVYLPAVDCAPILTKGWDRIILEKAALFPDGIGVVRTPFVHRQQFPPALQAVTAKFVKKVGYIYNPEYPFWFIDHEVHDLARLIGRYFVANVNVETAPMRPSKTIRLRDLVFWANYYDFMAIERRAKARSIIMGKDFKTPEWIKKDLIENYQYIEDDARAINDRVRAGAEHIERIRGEDGPPDEGYLRARQKAEAKILSLVETMKAA